MNPDGWDDPIDEDAVEDTLVDPPEPPAKKCKA